MRNGKRSCSHKAETRSDTWRRIGLLLGLNGSKAKDEKPSQADIRDIEADTNVSRKGVGVEYVQDPTSDEIKMGTASQFSRHSTIVKSRRAKLIRIHFISTIETDEQDVGSVEVDRGQSRASGVPDSHRQSQ